MHYTNISRLVNVILFVLEIFVDAAMSITNIKSHP